MVELGEEREGFVCDMIVGSYIVIALFSKIG